MIDLHSHILPGVDDGARDLDESIAIARAALEDGISAIAATPHVRADFPTTADEMMRLVTEVRAALESNQVRLELLSGGEIALDVLNDLSNAVLQRFGLGGNPEVLLIEAPYTSWSTTFSAALRRLLAAGFTPVIAHPERNPDVQRDFAKLKQLVSEGTLVQVTAASLEGRFGRHTRSTARRLLELELVHLLASDAHAPDIRTVGLSRARAAVGDEELGYWLTESVPAAIIAGRRLSPRPPLPRGRRLRLRLRQ